MKTQEIDLEKVWSLYYKVINIEEYYHPVKKWTSILPNGIDVREEMLYIGVDPTKDFDGDPPRERVVKLCIEAGATKIKFRCLDENKEKCFPDYNVSELLKP